MQFGEREIYKLNHYAQDLEQRVKRPFPPQDERSIFFSKQEKKMTKRKSRVQGLKQGVKGPFPSQDEKPDKKITHMKGNLKLRTWSKVSKDHSLPRTRD